MCPSTTTNLYCTLRVSLATEMSAGHILLLCGLAFLASVAEGLDKPCRVEKGKRRRSFATTRWCVKQVLGMNSLSSH